MFLAISRDRGGDMDGQEGGGRGKEKGDSPDPCHLLVLVHPAVAACPWAHAPLWPALSVSIL